MFANTPNIREALKKAEYGMYFHTWLTNDAMDTRTALEAAPSLTDLIKFTVSLNLLHDGLFARAMTKLVELKLEFAGYVVDATEQFEDDGTRSDFERMRNIHSLTVKSMYDQLTESFRAFLLLQFDDKE